MKKLIFSLLAGLFPLLFFISNAGAHCEIPCGIYDDQMRTKLIAEHATTIEKSMKEIQAAPNQNQAVRWVMNKEKHADELAQSESGSPALRIAAALGPVRFARDLVLPLIPMRPSAQRSPISRISSVCSRSCSMICSIIWSSKLLICRTTSVLNSLCWWMRGPITHLAATLFHALRNQTIRGPKRGTVDVKGCSCKRPFSNNQAILLFSFSAMKHLSTTSSLV